MAQEQVPASGIGIPNTATPTAEKPQNLVPRRLRQPTVDQLAPGQYCWGTGRRKSSVARVRLRPGTGKIIINKRELEKYFPRLKDQEDVRAPLASTDNLEKFDVFVNVSGGGSTGQSGAILMGLSRALVSAVPDSFGALRDAGFLTRDSRMVERKKYGLKKARKSFQFSKR